MAAERKTTFVNVDELMPKVSLEQAAAYYGVQLPALHQVSDETRTRCFLNCGRSDETGERAMAILLGSPLKTWHCHQAGCGKGGNLVSLCDLMKPGENAGGRPRGPRFKAIAADLKAMAEGVGTPLLDTAEAAVAKPAPEPPKVNLPLAKSEKERARQLTELDQKFVVDVATMTPKASAYIRRRPFLTPDVCRQ